MKWLRRDCHTLALCYGLCLTEVAFKKELVRLGIKEVIPFLKNEHSQATTQFLINAGNQTHCAIVCLHPAPDRPAEQVHGLLVHEAMHIWREHCVLIGEREPSAEFEAYAMQLISQELMLAYSALVPKPKPKKK